jgi:hypothetical protein
MTEYELVDAIASLNSILIQGQAITITALSGYMIVAYSVGAKLTTFQTAFISLLLVTIGFLGLQGQIYNLNEMIRYTTQLQELREGGQYSEATTQVTTWVFLGVRFLLVGVLLRLCGKSDTPK